MANTRQIQDKTINTLEAALANCDEKLTTLRRKQVHQHTLTGNERNALSNDIAQALAEQRRLQRELQIRATAAAHKSGELTQ